MTLTVQLFGTKKCQRYARGGAFLQGTRCASRTSSTSAQKAMSPGELRNVAARVGGFEALIDREGKRYVDKGLKYAAPTGPRIEQMLIADPLLLRTPIVRCGKPRHRRLRAGGLAGLDRRSEERVNDEWNTHRRWRLRWCACAVASRRQRAIGWRSNARCRSGSASATTSARCRRPCGRPATTSRWRSASCTRRACWRTAPICGARRRSTTTPFASSWGQPPRRRWRPARARSSPARRAASAGARGSTGWRAAARIAWTAGARVTAAVIHGLPGALRAAQATFDSTGGLHAAALFSLDGALLAVHEDVGRHNAVDKLVGRLLLGGPLPLAAAC